MVHLFLSYFVILDRTDSSFKRKVDVVDSSEDDSSSGEIISDDDNDEQVEEVEKNNVSTEQSNIIIHIALKLSGILCS